MKADSSQNGRQFYIPILFTIVTIVLGFISFDAVFPDYPFLRKLYYTFQLFTMESGDRFYENGPQSFFITLSFNLAKFFAVTTLILTVILAIMSLLQYQFFLSRIRYMKNHTILCGLGSIGEALARSFQNKKELLIIEKDIDKENLGELKRKGVKVIEANALDTAVLNKIGIEHARTLVALTGDDFDNFTIINNVIDLIKKRNWEKCRISLLANINSRNLKAAITKEWLTRSDKSSSELNNLLRDHREISNEFLKNSIAGNINPDLIKKYENSKRNLLNYDPMKDINSASLANIKLFNINQLAGRFIFSKYPPDRFRKITRVSEKAIKVLILGFSNIGEEVMKLCFQNCHYINRKNTKITIIDIDGEIIGERVRSKYKNINRIIDLNIIRYNPHHMTDRFLCEYELKDVDIIYICHSEDRFQTSYSSRARALFREDIPVIRPFYRDNVLSRIENINNIYSFNIFDQVSNQDSIINESFESRAIRVHNLWLVKDIKKYIHNVEDSINKKCNIPAPKATLVPWHLADQEIHEDNFSVVEHLNVKLRTVEQLNDPDKYSHPEDADINFSFLTDESIVNDLAEMEHRRWMANKFICGWVTGIPRNDFERKHDCLIDFNELKEEVKDYDRLQVREIEEIINLK